MSMVNTKLYRNDAQQAVSSIAIILGFVLIGLSLYQVHLEAADDALVKAAEGEGEEEGADANAPAPDQKGEEDKKGKKKEE